MEKLDKKFYGDIYKAKDHSVVADDEYVVFLAKDNAFRDALGTYLERCRARGCDATQIAMVVALIERVDAWRSAHPDRLKDPDADGEAVLA